MTTRSFFFPSAFLFLLAGCGVAQRDPAIMADEQISSGQVTMPTASNPISLGYDGMMYLLSSLADDGGLTKELSHYGACTGIACQWDPEVDNGRPFGTYTQDGVTVFYTQFPLGVQGRGNAAEPGSEMVNWDDESEIDAESQGVADGWYDLPWVGDFITVVSDCGSMHPNYYFGWDLDGNVDLPEDPSSIGENYCE